MCLDSIPPRSGGLERQKDRHGVARYFQESATSPLRGGYSLSETRVDALRSGCHNRTRSPLRPGGSTMHFVVALSLALTASADPAPKLYVANSAGNDLHVIDTATNRVLKRVEVGPQPHGLVATKNGD